MKFENVFSLKDFFNYYFPGFIWILCAVAIFIPIGDGMVWNEFFGKWNPVLRQISDAIWIIGLVVFPYLVGFVLNPLGELLTQVLRKSGNDAVIWATDPNEKLNINGLSSEKKDLVKKNAEKLFSVEKIDLSEYFYEIRSFVANHGGSAYELSVRALDIVNFSEAMLVPVPLLILILGIRFLSTNLILGIIVVGLAVLAILSLCRRYLYLRGYWVMHVYRAFLVIMSKEKLDISEAEMKEEKVGE